MLNAFKALNISGSGLSAERLRMDVISSNIANALTGRGTVDANGNKIPYRRKVPIFQTQLNEIIDKNNGQIKESLEGVKVAEIVEDKSPFRRLYDPSNPDADKDGYVLKSNVNILNEMTDMITAKRAFEANVTAINSEKSMFMKALEIGR